MNPMKPVFLSKTEREKIALEKLQEKQFEAAKKRQEIKESYEKFTSGKTVLDRLEQERVRFENEELEKKRRQQEQNIDSTEHEHELQVIREHYLGNDDKQQRKPVKPSEKFTRIFKFEWDTSDDTAKDDLNPLYSKRMKINALFGRGYIAGVDHKEQRKESNFLLTLSEKRLSELKNQEDSNVFLSDTEKKKRTEQRQRLLEQYRHQQEVEYAASRDEEMDRKKTGFVDKGKHWSEKGLEEMTDRDWRIFREDFDIRIQGGRATLPIRYWSEISLPLDISRAIEISGYKEPSPIQRQAIPIGLARRDIIGIAETGSGKTCAFLVPLLCYMFQLPSSYLSRCRDEGPLALVMAPTRELAQQIEEECKKLCQYTKFSTLSIVGGQSIEDQGFQLRNGIEIIIGTPGRIIDCIESNYLVLNQCNYVVLDEADRMIDMGFEPQVIAVLDNMGGLLKSEDEEQAELQLQQQHDRVNYEDTLVGNNSKQASIFRVTAMFSATMPTEVEMIAKKYLRHPVIVRIGDEDSGKNKRIEQRVMMLSENQKKGKLLEELRNAAPSSVNHGDCKVIVFVNEKKQGDMIGKYLDSLGYNVGILHGGKSQDQREDTLDMFRHNKIQILVATDVAGRGLDIPDVNFVINYDCPMKIQPYCHRIGRTGRAGKFGVAITFLTDTDTEVMYDLKSYLESTNSVIPPALLYHPAAQAPLGSRDDKGRLLHSSIGNGANNMNNGGNISKRSY